MTRSRRLASLAVVGAAATAASAAPAPAATIWTPLPSGTDGQISAIEYQSDSRFWYATTNGKLAYRQPDGTFAFGTGPGAVAFNDIAFQAAGQEGVAVGNGNNVWHSGDGGHSWSKVALPATIDNDDCSGAPGAGTSTFDIGFSVTYASDQTVYVTGDRGNILRSADGGDSFAEINKRPDTGCRVGASAITDSFFLDASTGMFLARYFGGVFATSDGLASDATERDEAVSNYTGVPRFAWNRNDTSRGWAVDRCLDCLYSTTDGGAAFQRWGIGGPEILPDGAARPKSLYDIASAGNTVVTVGEDGQVLTSNDGSNFFYQEAGGADATRGWRSVDMADGRHAAIGGLDGALAITTAADTVPDIVNPTATIAAPAGAIAGQPVTFTLNASDEGGSGLNPASFAWTSAGLPGKTGQSVSYTFPAAGFYEVKATFADKAGNAASVTAGISVSAPGQAKPSFSLSGPGDSATAKIVGSRVRVRMRGTVKPPTGVSVASACDGKVRLTIKKKRRTLLRTSAALKLENGRCRFGRTVYLKRSRVGGARRLRLKVRFGGNSQLAAGRLTKTLVVRK